MEETDNILEKQITIFFSRNERIKTSNWNKIRKLSKNYPSKKAQGLIKNKKQKG